MFEVEGWHKYGEVDSYEDGCNPDKYISYGGDERWSVPDLHNLLAQLRSFVCVDDDYEIELDACGEDGRVDISVMETGDSYPASEWDIEKWKKGELVLWYSTYTFYVQHVERRTVRLSED